MKTIQTIVGSAFLNLACSREIPDCVNDDFCYPPFLYKERGVGVDLQITLILQGIKPAPSTDNQNLFMNEKVWVIKNQEKNVFVNKIFRNKKGKRNKNKFKAPKIIKPKGKSFL